MVILAAKVSVSLSMSLALVKILTCMICSDVNECLKSNGGCDSKRTCSNTVGGRTCGNCPSGYVNDGDTGCKGQ